MAKPLVCSCALCEQLPPDTQRKVLSAPRICHDNSYDYDISLSISELSHHGGHQLGSSGRRSTTHPNTGLEKNPDIFRNTIQILYFHPLKVLCSYDHCCKRIQDERKNRLADDFQLAENGIVVRIRKNNHGKNNQARNHYLSNIEPRYPHKYNSDIMFSLQITILFGPQL